MKLTETQLQELAKQLRCPDENEGLQVAEMMNVTNANIINKAIAALHLKTGERVLEIGPGNERHIEKLLQVKDITYFGTDISEVMVTECNRRFSENDNVNVFLTDGRDLPFADLNFNKAFTVNTIYFWENPEKYCREIARTLMPGGLLCIGYIPERVMQNIPFAKYGFTLYSEDKVQQLLKDSGFAIKDQMTETELVTGNAGQQIEREFVIMSAVKQ